MLRPDMRVIHLRRMVSKSLPWKLQRNVLSKCCGWRQAAALTAQNNFSILVIVRNCLKAREPLTNLFAGLQKGTPVRYIDVDERQSRLVILVWSEADEVAAELGELTKSQVWVDELAYMAEKGRPDSASEGIHHEPHAPPPRCDVRFRQKLTKQRLLRLVMIFKRGPAVRCPARLIAVRSLLDEDESFLEITTLKFKSMFHTELQEVFLDQGERGRHISRGPIFYKCSFGHPVWNSLAKQTDWRFANPWFAQVVSHVWVVISRILMLFVCMYRVGGQFSVLFVRLAHQVCPRFVPEISRWCVFVLGFGRDDENPRLVLVGNCDQSFVHELWKLGSRLCW